MRATPKPDNATNKKVVWSSSNKAIATVNPSSGYIYAKTPGTARVYAHTKDGSNIYDYITVTVQEKIYVSSIELCPTSISVAKDDCVELSATVLPKNATRRSLNWTSSNPSIAAVYEGKVCGINEGTATITATATDDSGKSATCQVTVTGAVLVESITVYPATKTLEYGKGDFLHATVCPENAVNKTVEWSSRDPDIVIVSPTEGIVYGKDAGTTTVYATATDGSGVQGSSEVTVNPFVAVECVKISSESEVMNVGDTLQLTACVCPENATNKSIRWSSSNEDVATVNYYTGKVTAKKAGITTITATTADGGFQDCMTITVNYCGGSNYRDVTKHNMILQSDGYYVCSKCGYRIMSPSLQDRLILSSDDYLKVIALSHYYSQMILLADKYPLKAWDYNSFANSAKISIDTIRSKNEYNQLYDYKGSNGKYYCAETNNTTASFVTSSNINALTLGSYNGLYESIAELVLGYYCPEVALLVDITQLVTEESNALDFGSLIASLYDLDDYANALSIASTVLGMATSEVQIGDRVINISFNAYSHAEYVFDEDNRIKEVRIFNNF